MEPLVDCYQYVMQAELGVRLILADTWCREFQVLPGRTHPNMFTSTSGGYILSGVYVGTIGLKNMPMFQSITPSTTNNTTTMDIDNENQTTT